MQRNAECDAALGFENLEVMDSHLTAQSIPIHIRLEAGKEMDTHARCGRLNMHYCAFCGSRENGQYLQVDLRQDYKITAVATQGFEVLNNNYFVKCYNLSHSRDGQNWSIFPEVMKGNDEGRSVVRHTFSSTIDARYIRLYPTAYSRGGFCLRMELYGCSNSFSALTPTPSPSTQRGANNTTPENVSPINTTTTASSTEKSMIIDSATDNQPAVRRSKVLITTRRGQETTQMKWIILFLLIIIICLLSWFICSRNKTFQFLSLFQSQSGSMVV